MVGESLHLIIFIVLIPRKLSPNPLSLTFIEYTGHIFAGKPFYLLGGGYLKIIVSADELAEVVKGCNIICPI